MRPNLLIGLVMLLAAVCIWDSGALAPQASAQKPDPPRKDYELRVIRVANSFQAVRFKNSTGESWVMVADRYDKIPETGNVPAGDYDISLITDDTNWMAFRIDRLSGATWQLRDNKWNKVKEPGQKGP